VIDDTTLYAAFTAIGQEGWRSLHAPRLIDAAFARADRALIDDGAEQPLRDRLFDLTMRHFEALAPLRPGFRALANPRLSDPIAVLSTGPSLRRSIRRLLSMAGLSVDGPMGAARGIGMSAVYLAAFRVFLTDDGPDLGATMAELDRRLAQIEPWAERLNKREFFVRCKKDR